MCMHVRLRRHVCSLLVLTLYFVAGEQKPKSLRKCGLSKTLPQVGSTSNPDNECRHTLKNKRANALGCKCMYQDTHLVKYTLVTNTHNTHTD